MIVQKTKHNLLIKYINIISGLFESGLFEYFYHLLQKKSYFADEVSENDSIKTTDSHIEHNLSVPIQP